MELDLLKLMIQTACASGEVSADERKHLTVKAQEAGISKQDLDFLINAELNRVKSQFYEQSGFKNQPPPADNNQSGFITQENNQENNLSSGFITTDTPNNLDSGFVTPPPKNELLENQKLQQQTFTQITNLSQQGAMSLVQKAKYLGKWVIVKRLKPELKNDKKYKDLFYKEFENAYHLNHPHIVEIYGKGEDKDGHYFFMEYVDGRSLTKLIAEGYFKNSKEIRRIILQILDALSYVHKKQVFHRDLKPDNILLTYKGDNVKILDFGLAAADSFDDNMLKVGTPKYAAPEQKTAGNTVDQRADIYSLGLIMLEMLTGDVLIDKLPKDNEYASIIAKCIHPEIEKRYSNCDDIIQDLSVATQKVIPKWYEEKISQFAEDGVLTPNEKKVLQIEAQNNGIDFEYAMAVTNLELEKAKERIKQEQLIKKQEEEQRKIEQENARQRQQNQEKAARELAKKQRQLANARRQNITASEPQQKPGCLKRIIQIVLFIAIVAAVYFYYFPNDWYSLTQNLFKQENNVIRPGVKTMYVEASALNLRAEPDANGNIIGKYPKGTPVAVLKDKDFDDTYWVLVRVKGKTGYMFRKFLTTERPQ